jgi:hypothetical protein
MNTVFEAKRHRAEPFEGGGPLTKVFVEHFNVALLEEFSGRPFGGRSMTR